MPSMDNNNDTLSRIQRDIMEVTRREKELQAQYNNQNGTHSEDTNGNSSGQEVVSTNTNGTVSEPSTNGNVERASNWTPLLRAISTGSTLGAFTTQKSNNGEVNTRRFIAKGGNKGVMQKFLRAHGKLALVNTAISSAQPSAKSPIIPQNTLSRSFSTTNQPELDTSQVTVDPADPITKRKFVRNNYVPIEERMKREFQEMHSREKELNDDRRKSLTNLHTADYDEDNNSSHDSGEFNNYNKRHQMNGFSNGGGMTSARSLTQLYSNGGNFDNEDSDGEEDHDQQQQDRRAGSAQSGNLTRGKQMARSLADLCDVPDGEEFSTPGPRAMIMHFENMIRKNQLNRT